MRDRRKEGGSWVHSVALGGALLLLSTWGGLACSADGTTTPPSPDTTGLTVDIEAKRDVSPDSTGADSADSRSPDITGADVGPDSGEVASPPGPRTCGPTEDGGYVSCWTDGETIFIGDDGRPLDRYFTYCDGRSHTCKRPDARCRAGWCAIPPGSFLMGYDPQWDLAHACAPFGDEMGAGLPQHPVVLTRPFEIMQTEVTVAQWMDVMDTEVNPSRYPACGPDCPVGRVSLFAVLDFANRRSEREGLPACYTLEGCESAPDRYDLACAHASFVGADCTGYRLPSEAEWEYAARAGSRFPFPGGVNHGTGIGCWADDLPVAEGWYCANSAVSWEGCDDMSDYRFTDLDLSCVGPHPVGLLAPNRFGLKDVVGNFAEFTGTSFHNGPYPAALVVDPGFDEAFDPVTGGVGVRGGRFGSPIELSGIHLRGGAGLLYTYIKVGVIGFRLARTLSEYPETQ